MSIEAFPSRIIHLNLSVCAHAYFRVSYYASVSNLKLDCADLIKQINENLDPAPAFALLCRLQPFNLQLHTVETLQKWTAETCTEEIQSYWDIVFAVGAIHICFEALNVYFSKNPSPIQQNETAHPFGQVNVGTSASTVNHPLEKEWEKMRSRVAKSHINNYQPNTAWK